MWKNTNLQEESKVRMWKGYIRPILLAYTAETKTDTTDRKQFIETAGIKVLRKIIIKKKQRHHVTNEKVRQQCKIAVKDDWIYNRRRE